MASILSNHIAFEMQFCDTKNDAFEKKDTENEKSKSLSIGSIATGHAE